MRLGGACALATGPRRATCADPVDGTLPRKPESRQRVVPLGSTGKARPGHVTGGPVQRVDATVFGAREWCAVRGRSAALIAQDALVSLDPLRRVGAEIAEPMRLHRTVPRAQVACGPYRGTAATRGVPEPGARARPPGANRQPTLVHEQESHRLLRTRLLSGAMNECRYAS